MCQSCAQHSKRAWYLDKKHHSLESQGFIKDMVNWKILDLIELSNKMMISKKNRDGITLNQFTINTLNYFAKKVHGGQVVHKVDLALELIDMAKDIGLTYCICKKGFKENTEDDYRCILLNSFAGFMRRDHPEKIKFITKEQAKKFVIEKRQEGCFQSVFWGSIPYVSILCNCDKFCGSVVLPELDWAIVPSFFKVEVVNAKACNLCNKCMSVCYYKARYFEDKRPMVNDKCRGCGLCIEVCPENKVVEFVPRNKIYDPMQGKIVALGK